jgi:hypothetical protein
MIIIDNQFALGEIVFVKHDPMQNAGMVTAIKVGVNGHVYEVSCGPATVGYYSMELSKEASILGAKNEILRNPGEGGTI